MQRKVLAASALALVIACDSGTDPVNVAGTWSGTLSVTIKGTAQDFPVSLVLTQSGANVSGKLTFTGTSQSGNLSGTATSTSLDISATPDQTPASDCHLYSLELFFSVSDNTMTATGAGGVYCQGNGTGGHFSLDPVTAASGTLTRS